MANSLALDYKPAVIAIPTLAQLPAVASVLTSEFKPYTFLRDTALVVEDVLASLAQILGDPRLYFRVALADEVVIGVILGVLGRNALSPRHTYVTEQALWVAEGARGTSLAARLLRGLAVWGYNQGARWLCYARPLPPDRSTPTKLVEEVIWKTL